MWHMSTGEHERVAGCQVCPRSYHLRGGNTPHAAPPRSEDPAAGRCSISPRATRGPSANEPGPGVTRQDRRRQRSPLLPTDGWNAGCLTCSSSRGGKKSQFGCKRTQVERHNQRGRLRHPLSLDCELSFVCLFLSWWVK